MQGDTEREAISSEVSVLKEENSQLKYLVADLSLGNKILKKSLVGMEAEFVLIPISIDHFTFNDSNDYVIKFLRNNVDIISSYQLLKKKEMKILFIIKWKVISKK